jgi:hypothetical protein
MAIAMRLTSCSVYRGVGLGEATSQTDHLDEESVGECLIPLLDVLSNV